MICTVLHSHQQYEVSHLPYGVCMSWEGVNAFVLRPQLDGGII